MDVWWIPYVAVAAFGFIIGILLRRGAVSKNQLEDIKKQLMKIPKDKLPEEARLILCGVIIALMMWTGEVSLEEGEAALVEVNKKLMSRGLEPVKA